MTPSTMDILGTVLFAVAVLHTFLIKVFQHLARQFREGSMPENFFHLLGEVEIIFGFWAGVLVVLIAAFVGWEEAVNYINKSDFTEPVFVFVIMAVTATKPVIEMASRLIGLVAFVLPLRRELAFFVAALVVGPLLGSFITEPAAMIVTALILKDRFFGRGLSDRFMYLSLGVLFVNISIGGVLTPFAAPPVLMVAGTWKWGLSHMMRHFGWKAALAVLANTGLVAMLCFREIASLESGQNTIPQAQTPWWLRGMHLGALILIIVTAHYPAMFVGFFLFFLGMVSVTHEYQDELELRQSLLVGFFLAGLVVLGGFQRWWLGPLIQNLDALPLYLGTTALTAITDNAALTYLGSQIPNVGEQFKYALVAGAVSGGGLTVIANAPNPAGFSILRDSFGPEGINPLKLLLWALLPTLITMACFWWLPSF